MHHQILRAGHLVARALRNDLALKLGERQKDVQRQAAEGTRRVELLGHRHEAHSVPVEDLDDSREIEQGSTEPVDLVHHDAVHRPSLDRCQEPLQGRAIHIAAGVPAIVEMVGDHLPALVLLAGNEGLRCFPLRVKGVELIPSWILTRAAGGNLAPSYHLAAPSRPWRPCARTRANSGEPTANGKVWCLLGSDSAGAPRVFTRCRSAPTVVSCHPAAERRNTGPPVRKRGRNVGRSVVSGVSVEILWKVFWRVARG
jgi:hypothetical protein